PCQALLRLEPLHALLGGHRVEQLPHHLGEALHVLHVPPLHRHAPSSPARTPRATCRGAPCARASACSRGAFQGGASAQSTREPAFVVKLPRPIVRCTLRGDPPGRSRMAEPPPPDRKRPRRVALSAHRPTLGTTWPAARPRGRLPAMPKEAAPTPERGVSVRDA